MNETVEPKPMTYIPKTDAVLRQLALDVAEGRVWTDRDGIEPFRMISAFLDEPTREFFKKLPAGLIYEYIDKAGPRSVNGQPQFFSMEILNRADFEKFREILLPLLEQRRKFLNGETA